MSRTAEMYEEMVSLRDQGLSMSQIGRELGCSKQYVSRLLKNGPPKGSTKASTGGNPSTPLSVRQRRYAKGLLEGKTQRQAALDAVPPGTLTENGADSWSRRTNGDGGFQESFQVMLERCGLSEDDLARVHAANLEATRVVGFRADAEGRKLPIEHPDYGVRQRAVDSGWEIQGRKGRFGSNPSDAAARPQTVIQINYQAAEMLKGISGGVLPPVIEVVPDEELTAQNL